VGCVDEHAVGAALELEVAVSLEDGGELVVDDLVGMEDVGAVVDHDVTFEGENVADAGLTVGIQLDRNAAGGGRFWFGHGNYFLAGIVGELTGSVGRGRAGDGGRAG
jgi:hypothetical protein